MNKVSRNKNSIKLTLVALCILLLVSGVFFALERTGTTDFVKNPFVKSDTETPSGPTKEQKEQEMKSSTQSKGEYLDSSYNNSTAEKTNTGTPSNHSLEITASQQGQTIVVLTKIYGINSGTCVLTVSNSGRTFSQKADVVYQPEYSSCAGFGVPVSSVGTGNWSISLQLNDPGHNTTSQQTTLEVK